MLQKHVLGGLGPQGPKRPFVSQFLSQSRVMKHFSDLVALWAWLVVPTEPIIHYHLTPHDYRGRRYKNRNEKTWVLLGSLTLICLFKLSSPHSVALNALWAWKKVDILREACCTMKGTAGTVRGIGLQSNSYNAKLLAIQCNPSVQSSLIPAQILSGQQKHLVWPTDNTQPGPPVWL